MGFDPLPWGAHLCHFYRTAQDLVDTLVPYFVAGINNRERCLWLTGDPLSVKEAKAALAAAVPSLDQRIAAGQVSILDGTRDSSFTGEKFMQQWWAEEARARATGFEGLRLAANVFWLERRDWQRFNDYETIVNQAFASHRIIAACGYNLDRCEAHDLVDVLGSHDYSLLRRDGKCHVVESEARRSARLARERLIEEMVAIVAHELGNPLNAVRMTAELIERRGTESELARRILRGSDEIQRMSDDLVDVTRGRDIRLVRERVDLHQLCLDVVGELRRVYPQRAIEFQGQPAAKGEWDAPRVRRALFNLLKNAIVHGAPERPVAVGMRPHQDRWLVEVRNQGVIAEGMLERMFQPFVRGPSSRGLGLGLYIAKTIIDSHGGSLQLRVSSTPHEEVVVTALL